MPASAAILRLSAQVLAAALAACGPAATKTSVADAAADARPPVVLPRGITPAPYVPIEKVVSDCSVPQGSPYQPASASEVVSLLVGRWQRCNGAFAGGTAFDGVKLDRDRRWLVLGLENGALVPATGPDTEAIWFLDVEDTTGMFQISSTPIERLQLIFDRPTTIGQVAYGVAFFQQPTRFRLADSMIFTWLGE